jgi:hypothetical protein
MPECVHLEVVPSEVCWKKFRNLVHISYGYGISYNFRWCQINFGNLIPNFTEVIFVQNSGNPNVAKVGGLQSQGVKGEAVVAYCDPLTTQNLKASGFPRCFKGKKQGKIDPSFEYTDGDIQELYR